MTRQVERAENTGLATLLRDIPAPIFAAAWARGQGGSRFFVHLAAAPKRAALRGQIKAALHGAGVSNLRIRFHNAAQLHAPRSLERLVARFAGDEIVYDPTGAVARARALVAASQTVRASLAGKLFGLYYAPHWRTVYVALKAESLAVGDKVKIAALAEVERAVGAAMTAAFAPSLDDCPAVRVGFGLPAAPLVAIDSRSAESWTTRFGHTVRRFLKPVTLAALFGFGLAGSAAARDPAVSETNLKITGQGGEISDDGAWVFGGQFTAPLGQYTGVAVDAGGAGVDGDTTWGVGGHLFTRDPDKYLLGVFAAYAKESDFDVDVTRIGAEAEIYLNQISILAAAGYQFSDRIDDTAFGRIDLRWYALDNLAFTVGGNFAENTSSGHLAIEFMPGFSALPGLAFNVRGTVGDDDFQSVLGGMTYYFGSDMSLKDRHRRQDPESSLYALFESVQQERDRLAAQYGQHTPTQ